MKVWINFLVCGSCVLMTPLAQADDLLNILETKKGTQQSGVITDLNDLSSVVRASVKAPTASQNIFFELLKENKYDKALYQWFSAFPSKQGFAKSSTGQALLGYLLYNNGLKVVGLEALLAANPKYVVKPLLQTWKDLAPPTEASWNYVRVTPHKGWKVKLSPEIQAQLLVPTLSVKTKGLIFDAIKKTTPQMEIRSWLEWQMALALLYENQVAKAAKVLSHLLKNKQKMVSEDLINITISRLLYEKGHLTMAIKYYDKIPKKSDYWFVAQEEKSWAFLRKGEPQNVLAVTSILSSDWLKYYVGPETFLTRSLAQLKTCDYSGVLETLKSFQALFKERVEKMQVVARHGSTPEVESLLSEMKKGARPKMMDLKEKIKALPQYITRDQNLIVLVRVMTVLEKEAEKAKNLYLNSLPNGTEVVGFQGALQKFKKHVDARYESVRSAIYNRIKGHAQAEIKETARILSKMQIVEAELLQQTLSASQVLTAGKASNSKMSIKKGKKKAVGRYGLEFMAAGKEIWFDEITDMKVDLKKSCQQ